MAKGQIRLVDKDYTPPEQIADSHQSLFARAMSLNPVNMAIGVISTAGTYHVVSDLESDLAEAGFIMKMYDASGPSKLDDGA